MNKITLTAFPVKQGGTTLYLSAIPAGDLIDDDNYRIDRWNPVSQEGYQREINQSHAHRLARYLSRGTVDENPNSREGTGDRKVKGKVNFTNVLPGSVVINFRHPFKVTELPNTGGAVGIEINEFPGYIIDGQHRIEGISEDIEGGSEDLKDYEFPVTLTQFALEEEMIHFRNLNTTANRPPKGLNEAISHALYAQYGRIPATWAETASNRATGITMRLASDQTSPWYGKIALGGVRKRAMHMTVQSQFTGSIVKLFTAGRFSDPDLKLDVAYDMILNFWLAVQKVWPEAVNTESSVILKPSGYNSLNRLLDKILNNVTLNPSYEDFVEMLQNIRDNSGITDDGWDRNKGTVQSLLYGYSYNKGYSIAADMLWSALDDKTKLKIKTKLPVQVR